ncbi:melanocortin receptor 4-like [Oculina patagonica]
MENLSEYENHTASMCTTGLYGKHEKMFFSALSSTLSITAFLGNVLIIFALQKVSSLHPPSKFLLSCLASTDLCVGLIAQPLRAALLSSPEHSNRCYYLKAAFDYMIVVLGGVSLLTITAISVDRLLALLLGLRYRHVVTLRRARMFVAIFWFFNMITPLLYLYSVRLVMYIICTTTFLCIVSSTLCYTMIFLTLRHRQAQVKGHVHQGQPNGGEMPLNIARYRKTVSSALWILITLVACYFPYAIVSIFAIMGLDTQFYFFAWEVTISLFMLNSTLNPFLYCWKMREVRQAVKNTLGMFCCSSS